MVGGALTVTTLVISVAYWVATTHKEKPVVLPQSVPIDVHQQLSGYTFTHSDGDRRVFTVHAARTVSFKQGGTTVLEDVLVELFGRTGKRRDIMRTQTCDYNGQNGDLFSSGPVHIELNAEPDKAPTAGLKGRQTVYLETSKVSYRHEGSLVVSEQEVRFRIGPATGTSQGMVYATRDGSLELEKGVVVQLQPHIGHASDPPLQLTASRLRYDKLSRQVILWGPVQVTQGERKVSADSGKVFLNEANRVTRGIWKAALRLRNLPRIGWSNSRLIALRATLTRHQGHCVFSQPKGMWRGYPRKKGASVASWRKGSNSVLPAFPQSFKAGMHRITYNSGLNLHLPWARLLRKQSGRRRRRRCSPQQN